MSLSLHTQSADPALSPVAPLYTFCASAKQTSDKRQEISDYYLPQCLSALEQNIGLAAHAKAGRLGYNTYSLQKSEIGPGIAAPDPNLWLLPCIC